jgi:predicted esterase
MHPHHLEVNRTARYFTLGDGERPPRELWVGLHGYAQLAARFLPMLAPLDDGRTLIAAPEALSRFYLETRLTGHHGPAIGATWLTREHREPDLRDHLRYLDTLLERLLAPFPSRPAVSVLGFSQGASLAARWVATGAVRPARLVLWGVPLPQDVPLEPLVAALAGAPVVLAAGTSDPYVPGDSLEQGAALLAAAGARVEVRRFEGGHVIPAADLLAVAGRGDPD